jgi:gluconolactonase
MNMKPLFLLIAGLLLPGITWAVEDAPKYAIEGKYSLSFEIDDPAFSKIIGEKPGLTLLANGFGFSEGPVYFSKKEGSDDGFLIFTDMVNDNIDMIEWYGAQPFNKISNLSWGPTAVFRNPASRAIGQTADLSGHLLTCEMASRRVSITMKDGSVKTLVGSYKGTPLNSPNDVVVKSDGTVWFTDPSYGALKYPQDANLPCNVYRFDPKTNELTIVVSDLVMPNGIAFSPDEKLLYVIDTGASMAAFTYNEKGPHDIHVYDMSADGKSVSNGRVFVTVAPGFPDGMRLDVDGNLYVGALDGIQVFNPEGKLLGKILLPRQTANMCFGGKDDNILFICSSDAVWAVRLNTKGAKPVPVLKSGDQP